MHPWVPISLELLCRMIKLGDRVVYDAAEIIKEYEDSARSALQTYTVSEARFAPLISTTYPTKAYASFPSACHQQHVECSRKTSLHFNFLLRPYLDINQGGPIDVDPSTRRGCWVQHKWLDKWFCSWASPIEDGSFGTRKNSETRESTSPS